MGCEKFFNIKCRASGLKPDAAAIVATVRALKFHGGVNPSDAGKENIEALRAGCSNLLRHVSNLNKFGIPVVVVLNQFTSDTESELQLVKDLAKNEAGAFDVVVSNHWAKGGAGAVAVAEALVRATETVQPNFKFLYPDSASIKEKIETVCKEIYDASASSTSTTRKPKLQILKHVATVLPVCMANAVQLLAQPELKVHQRFTVPIHDIRVGRVQSSCSRC